MAGRFDASPTTELIPLGGCDRLLVAELADVLSPTGIPNTPLRDASAKPRAERAKALCAEKPSSSATVGRERVWPSIRRTTNSALRADNIAKCHAAGCALLVTRAPVAAQTFGHVLDRTSPDDELVRHRHRCQRQQRRTVRRPINGRHSLRCFSSARLAIITPYDLRPSHAAIPSIRPGLHASNSRRKEAFSRRFDSVVSFDTKSSKSLGLKFSYTNWFNMDCRFSNANIFV